VALFKGKEMTKEEKADIMHALELGLDSMILVRDKWFETYGMKYKPHVLLDMNSNIELVEKAQEIMRLA
jgi:hypothetical protein